MRISDHELSEKILAYLALKGKVPSQVIVQYCETWVSASKTRSMLKDLETEDEIVSSKMSNNPSAKISWELKSTGKIYADTVEKITEFLSSPEKKAEAEVMREKRNSIVGEFDKVMKIVMKDVEIEAALARELSLMLKKQERRKYWAESVLKTSTGMIALINDKIAELV